MSSIRGIETALPLKSAEQDEVLLAAEGWLADHPESLALFKRFVQSAQNYRRHFTLNFSQILELSGLKERAELFETMGADLGVEALNRSLLSTDTDPGSIGCHIFTSCTCPTIPAIDALIIEHADLRRTTARIPIYQQGCAGGVVGLALAAKLASTYGRVALTSVELCSLVFAPQDPRPSQLVGSAIFGDGAASVIVDVKDQGLVFIDSESYLVPDSRHLMGYDTFDDGFRLRLDRALPQQLASFAPQRVEEFLGKSALCISDINYWLFHPGGMRILESLENLLCRPEQAYWSREVLQQVGNLSSASVLFVLKAFLKSNVVKAGDRVVMLGVGPGLTIELILFEYS